MRPVLEKNGKCETLLKTQQPTEENLGKYEIQLINAHMTAPDQQRLQQLEAAIEAGQVDPRSALAQEFQRPDKRDCMQMPDGDMLSHCDAATHSVCSLVPRTRTHMAGDFCSHGQRFFDDTCPRHVTESLWG